MRTRRMMMSVLAVVLLLAMGGCTDLELKSIIASIVGASTALPAPQGITVSSPTITTLGVSWAGVTGATGYRVYRDVVMDGSFPDEVYQGTATAFTDSGLVSGSTYHYKVLAENGAGAGELSSSAQGTTLLFLYVANSNANSVSAFRVDPATGGLTALTGSPYGTGSSPQSVTVDRACTVLYTANWDGTLSIFTIEPATGELAFQATKSAYSGTMGVAVDPGRTHLYAANCNAGTLSGYLVTNDTGALTEMVSSPWTTGAQPYAVAVHPSDAWVYSANASGGNVSIFSADPSSGHLAELASSPVTTAAGTVSLAVDLSGKWLWAGSTTSQRVYGFFINQSSGILSAVGGSPFNLGCAPWSLVADPQRRFLYVVDVNGDDITAAKIDGSTGVITEVTGSPYSTGSNTEPRSAALDAEGRYLYAAYSLTDSVGVFAVDQSTGGLVPVGTPVAAGDGPMSLVTTRGF